LRTQITRTTDAFAFAFADAPSAFAPPAFRTVRTASAGTSTACVIALEVSQAPSFAPGPEASIATNIKVAVSNDLMTNRKRH
jgi:hypothetical protein